VEGWSAIGKWRGVPLSTVIAMAQPKLNARYCVFHCFDVDQSGEHYYESLDLHEAAHPQTVLALDLNDKPLDADHGAPVRLKIPTQLGYKSAKWVQRIELVADLHPIAGGGGGYWEDQGYEWYAGI
jgi:DMSO/TMAO reductase YedYZ molybdopterin-dependent catalytic subunit